MVLTDELLAEDSKNKHTNSALSIKVRQLSLAAEEARALRDDLDVWKARAQLNERNKTEIERFREKMEDFDYVKRAYEVCLCFSVFSYLFYFLGFFFCFCCGHGLPCSTLWWNVLINLPIIFVFFSL